MPFLPITIEEIHALGVKQPDFVLVTGDAYVDHPSFGAAVIGRVLEHEGFTIGVIAQPNWNDPEAFNRFGKPRYAFLITSGNIDSMVCHYSVARKKRHKDYYTPGGEMGRRPDRAAIVYANKIRELYKNTPIILGGIEASLRRLSHYDYWSDSVRRSCLLDAGADLIVYGMGEHPITAIASAFRDGLSVDQITFVKGTVYKTRDISGIPEPVELPAYTKVKSDRIHYAESFRLQYLNTDAVTAKVLVESYGNIWVVQNPPAPPLVENELDTVYALPFMRRPHPMYDDMGGVPAIEEVEFSITSNRGCFGSCNFCALTFHQGRTVTSRSHHSILQEAEAMTTQPNFKGYIHDVGGPTANFRRASCDKQLKYGVCPEKMCLTPQPCKNLVYNHKDYLVLLHKLREIPKVKKVFIRSGIRYDYLINDKDNNEFFEELCKHHISGQLKVAPEHVSRQVLEHMGKPTKDVYNKFVKKYTEVNKKLGMNQFLVPYLMSSHPGSDLNAAIELAEYLRDMHLSPEQVQDFYPTPGTLSTCMYHTGIDPLTGVTVYVPKTAKEKMMQRALIQYRLPQNYHIVYEALQKAERQDLIGFDKHCLIRPRQQKQAAAKLNKNDKVKSITGTASHSKTQDRKPTKKKTIRNIHKKKHI